MGANTLTALLDISGAPVLDDDGKPVMMRACEKAGAPSSLLLVSMRLVARRKNANGRLWATHFKWAPCDGGVGTCSCLRGAARFL